MSTSAAEILAQKAAHHRSILKFRPPMPTIQDIHRMRNIPETALLADAKQCRLNAVQASDRAAADARRAADASNHAFTLAKEGRTAQANAFAQAALTLAARTARHRVDADLATKGAIHAMNRELHPIYFDMARTEAYGANAEHYRASLWEDIARQATAFFSSQPAV